MTMKGLPSSRSHHHSLAPCEPSYDSLTLRPDHSPFLLDSVDHSFYSSYPANLPASSTFPRHHYATHHQLKNKCGAVVPYMGPASCSPPTSPALYEQFTQHCPPRRDGYHTLQYKRTAALEHQRSDSPGRIRNLVHSVQKLFTKSHSLEGPSQRSLNGNDPADLMPTASESQPNVATLHQPHGLSKRPKNKERSRSEPKPHPCSSASGYWSSDDTPDREICLCHHHHQHHPQSSGVMTMGRQPDKSQSHYFLQHTYNTLGSNRLSLKTSRSNNDVGKCAAYSRPPGCTVLDLPSTVGGGLEGPVVKKSSWSSTLTVRRAQEVYQKSAIKIDKVLVKAQSYQQGRNCQFLQVGLRVIM